MKAASPAPLPKVVPKSKAVPPLQTASAPNPTATDETKEQKLARLKREKLERRKKLEEEEVTLAPAHQKTPTAHVDVEKENGDDVVLLYKQEQPDFNLTGGVDLANKPKASGSWNIKCACCLKPRDRYTGYSETQLKKHKDGDRRCKYCIFGPDIDEVGESKYHYYRQGLYDDKGKATPEFKAKMWFHLPIKLKYIKFAQDSI